MHVQIVKFKLKPDTSRLVFLELVTNLTAWLECRSGFIAYELYEGTEYWTDRIVWDTEKSAQAGLKDFVATDIAEKLIQLVEEGYSSFFGNLVVHCLPLQSKST